MNRNVDICYVTLVKELFDPPKGVMIHLLITNALKSSALQKPLVKEVIQWILNVMLAYLYSR